MRMTQLYHKYRGRILLLLASIKTTCEEYGYHMEDVFECSDEEYSWMLVGKPADHLPEHGDNPGFDIVLTILESKFNDGADEYGVNFGINVSCDQGHIIGGLTPFNYSDRVWVSRTDRDAVEARWDLFRDAVDPDAIVSSVQDHFNEP